MDSEGVSCIFSTMKDLATRGRTIIVVSHDPKIVRGAQVTIDLNAKPIPRVTERQQPIKTTSIEGEISS
jgi:ABC-type lipoprotein export system ATPase subunit